MEDIYMEYVDARTHEADDGTWWICDPYNCEELISGPHTEKEIEDILWSDAIKFAHEVLIP